MRDSQEWEPAEDAKLVSSRSKIVQTLYFANPFVLRTSYLVDPSYLVNPVNSSLPNNLSHLSCQVLQRKWLLQKCSLGFEHALIQNRVFTVSRQKQYLALRTYFQQLASQFAATHPGHDHVCDHEVNGLRGRRHELQSFLAVFRLYHLVPAAGQGLGHKLPD